MKLVPWVDLPLEAVATLLATDFQNGLSQEDASARLVVIHRGNSALRGLLSAFRMLFHASRERKEIRVVRQGHLSFVPRRSIVPGDVIELTGGEYAPGDGLVISADKLAWRQGRIQHIPEATERPTPGILLRKGTLILSGRARLVVVLGTAMGS